MTDRSFFGAYHFLSEDIDKAFHASSLVSSVIISLLISLINNMSIFFTSWTVTGNIVQIVVVSVPSIVS